MNRGHQTSKPTDETSLEERSGDVAIRDHYESPMMKLRVPITIVESEERLGTNVVCEGTVAHRVAKEFEGALVFRLISAEMLLLLRAIVGAADPT